MEPVRIYRNISSVDKFFGLELADWCVLLIAFFLAFSLNGEGLLSNAVALFAVYLCLRTLKKGKPDGYLLVLCRHLLMSRFKRRAGFEEAERL